MPYGLKLYQQAESLYFITFSCYHLPYLSTPQSKSTGPLGASADLHDEKLSAITPVILKKTVVWRNIL